MASPRRSHRTRTLVRSYEEAFEDTLGDGNASIPSPPRDRKKARPVVIDSGDESDGLSNTLTRPAKSARENQDPFQSHPKREAELGNSPYQPHPKREADLELDDISSQSHPNGEADDEIHQILAALAAEEGTEEDFDLEEEEVFEGPDEVDEIVDDANAVHDDLLDEEKLEEDGLGNAEAGTFDEAFERMLRKMLQSLIGWVKAQDYRAFKQLHSEHRPVTFTMFHVLGKVSIDFLLKLYLAAIPLQVQQVLTKKTWTREDFLSLPNVKDNDMRPGIYGDFATGELSGDPQLGVEAYVGSTIKLARRVRQHEAIGRNHTPATLPKKNRNSFHYQQICRSGVSSNFRVLAVFREHVEPGYLTLLEGIMMIILGSYNNPGYTTKYNPASSYDLVSTIRKSVSLPKIPWTGLNAAFSLKQGFVAASVKKPSKCCNPACSNMTYRPQDVPEGESRTKRLLEDPGNPLGGFICGACGNYRQRHGRLPDAALIMRLATIRNLRQIHGDDASCHNCGVLESEIRKGTGLSADGTKTYTWKVAHQGHSSYPGKVFCGPCIGFLNSKGRLRTQDEVQQLKAARALKKSRKTGNTPQCENCGAIEGGLGVSGKMGIREGQTLCTACVSYVSKHGKMRDPGCQRQSEARAQAELDRKAGRPVTCKHCGKVEPTETTRNTAFRASTQGGMICVNCHGRKRLR